MQSFVPEQANKLRARRPCWQFHPESAMTLTSPRMIGGKAAVLTMTAKAQLVKFFVTVDDMKKADR